MKYLLTIAYDGTDFGGWQCQPNATSIQETIEDVLFTLFQEPIAITGSGRTDAGVHALGQTAHFSTTKSFSPFKALGSLNALLPSSIRILSLEPVPKEFHARYSALKKTYHYHLLLSPTKRPLQSRFCHRPHFPLNLDQLRRAASHFVGTHDFSAFAGKAHEGSAAKNPIRTLYRLDVIPEEMGVRLEFEGNGFLYKMVRNITGTLLDICAGKILETEIPEIFASKDRSRAGKTAPPQALFLKEVCYILPGKALPIAGAKLYSGINSAIV